jgi:hypothetical protein
MFTWMGTSVLDGRPTPAGAIGRFRHAVMGVSCIGCGKRNGLQIGQMMRRHGLTPQIRFHQVETRLRCMTCGHPGRIREVRGWR